MWRWLLIGSMVAVCQADQYPELEAELGRDPAAVLAAVEPLQAQAGQSPEQKAELHLLAAEAQAMLTRGREALNEADAGLALLPPAPGGQLLLTPLAIRLQLIRALAQDLLGQSAQALPAVNRLLDQLSADTPEQQQVLVEVLNARGSLLLSLTDLPGALADMQRAYALAQEDDARVSRGDIAALIANLYARQQDTENALRYYREAVNSFQRSHSDIKLSIAVYGIGTMYRDSKNWPEARRHFGWSLELSRKRGDRQGVAYAQQQLAHIAVETGQFDEAKNLLDAAQPLFEQAEDHAMVINSKVTRADLAGKLNHYDEAMRWLQDAELLAKKTDQDWKEPVIWERRAMLLAEQRLYEQAYEAYRTFHQLHEASFRGESDRQLQELRVRFDSERQEQQNELLRQQNALQEAALQQQRQRLWLYVAVALLSLLSTLFLLYSIYKGRQVRRKLDELAHTDELTGLPNRRSVMQEAQLEIDRSRRYRLPLCLAAIDLDQFKSINDRFGHAAGDEVLKHFARLCQQSLRQTDLIGRVGGEEFILMLPHTSLTIARQILERLREDFKLSAIPALTNKHQPSISIGVTVLSEADEGLAELMRRADEALYCAKQNGRDQVVVREHPQAPAVGSQAGEGFQQYEKY
ncbi:GGDEF domain-containing protein [Permianibacter sp. IMCC34836]|uniref:tetratricopeptide repeat-containing diguanylate cyclase n=1 Tax=Permianibacter fluminis TaxID=2738515 RepID=UPI0015523DBC|nr:tetratricopeptide repeat-containing diguanylate cyclase [Permianibacter fluminis]NQD35834.1 GGDEF domain-containing protein [Permianibacter fluminis]